MLVAHSVCSKTFGSHFEIESSYHTLWVPWKDSKNRTLLKIEYSKGSKEKSKEDQNIIKILMGDEVAPRKDFITEKALEVENLDI